MALKLDIAKAFDKVEWRFIDTIMMKMGFCDRWREWIKICISSVSYSVLLNGEPTREIKPKRGLRQGDPISPYLYIICTEGLSRLIKNSIHAKKLHGFKASRSGPAISHLFFADDSLVFCKATLEEAKNLSHILDIYKQASGQEVNFSKSAVTFGKGTPHQLQQQIMNELGISKMGGFGKYLGLPECIGRNRKETFNYITQRIRNKLDSWYSKFLSPAGKEVLLKAVIAALPAYTMSCFLLPKNLIQEITKAMRQFWWSATKEKHNISWIAWNKITASRKEGGLGIRDMYAFNKALLAKQAWRLMTCPTTLLARVYKAKYYRKVDFMEAECYKTSSYAWRSIIQTQPLISQGTKWIVGDGERIRFWEDKWLPQQYTLTPKTPRAYPNPHLRIKDLFIPGTKTWDEQKLRNLIEEREVASVLSIRPSSTGVKDKIFWSYTTSGTYSVKSGYYTQRQMDLTASQNTQVPSSPYLNLRNKLSARIWRLNIPPKIKMFWWRILHNGIPVADNLSKRGIKIAKDCQTCGEESETLPHMLFYCRVAKEIWSLSEVSIADEVTQTDRVFQTILSFLESSSRDPQATLPWFLGWRIWKIRKKIIFQNRRDHILNVIHAAYLDHKSWMEATNKTTTHNDQPKRMEITSIQETLRPETLNYCVVDASWVSPHDKTGIGWSLYSRQGTLNIHGSSAIHQTISPLVAEATAMLLAVQQMVRLAYKEVMFITDCQALIKILHQVQGRENHIEAKMDANEASTIIQDIWNYSKKYGFEFSYAPRNCTQYVDWLAKKARINNQPYVISWLT